LVTGLAHSALFGSKADHATASTAIAALLFVLIMIASFFTESCRNSDIDLLFAVPLPVTSLVP
jgi:hypothetical protein